MTTRKPLVTALIVGLVVLAASVSVGAGASDNDKMTRLSRSRSGGTRIPRAGSSSIRKSSG